MPNLSINGQSYFADAPSDTPLLWVIREDLRLTGTKYGCGIGQCGACTVHVDGEAVRSCLVTVADVEGARLVRNAAIRAAAFPRYDCGKKTVLRIDLVKFHHILKAVGRSDRTQISYQEGQRDDQIAITISSGKRSTLAIAL